MIHGGHLMTVGQAWVEMMEEFPPHGYTSTSIKIILDRAHAATQNLLRQISALPEAEGAVRLDWALRADAAAAERWRSQWPGYKPQVSSEDHAERMARYRRDQEFQEKALREQEKEWNAKEKEREANRRVVLEAQRKAERARQFESWVERNETGGWKAQAAERARSRQAKDQAAYQAIMRRIRERHDYWVPPLRRGGAQESMLCLLTDHEYVEWMFRCYEHELTFR